MLVKGATGDHYKEIKWNFNRNRVFGDHIISNHYCSIQIGVTAINQILIHRGWITRWFHAYWTTCLLVLIMALGGSFCFRNTIVIVDVCLRNTFAMVLVLPANVFINIDTRFYITFIERLRGHMCVSSYLHRLCVRQRVGNEHMAWQCFRNALK